MRILAAVVLLQGCSSAANRGIPVVDAGSRASEGQVASPPAVRPQARAATVTPAPAAVSPAPADEYGVVVMVPAGQSAPLQTGPSRSGTAARPASPQSAAVPMASGASAAAQPANAAASSVTASSSLAADEQLDGPVLALLTTARRQQSADDLDGAASSLERAQRIAPQEPQVLYQLARVRLAQGDVAQAEQLSRRALGYAASRPALQASLWGVIAEARAKQGDAAGAAQARQKAGG